MWKLYQQPTHASVTLQIQDASLHLTADHPCCWTQGQFLKLCSYTPPASGPLLVPTAVCTPVERLCSSKRTSQQPELIAACGPKSDFVFFHWFASPCSALASIPSCTAACSQPDCHHWNQLQYTHLGEIVRPWGKMPTANGSRVASTSVVDPWACCLTWTPPPCVCVCLQSTPSTKQSKKIWSLQLSMCTSPAPAATSTCPNP